MSEEPNLYGGDIAISTPYGVLYIRNNGREITFRIHDSVSQNEHNKRLFNYVKWLHDNGVDRINSDHISFDFLDRSLSLRRGSRILDIVYEKGGRLYECEVKTTREIWLDRTAEQLKEMERHCENLILLVPRQKIETTQQLMKSLNLLKLKVDTYET